MEIIKGGIDISKAKKALILIHGRGANAGDFLSLGSHLNTEDFALFAPQAPGNTWYPYSFLAPLEKNEPSLSSSLKDLEILLMEIERKGIAPENIYFVGFSQGACLTLE
ncbi:MAG TPA: phospholipase, partial [Salinimicrobium sp.]|nr:phospholipase [Salinimicrobium sp.]